MVLGKHPLGGSGLVGLGFVGSGAELHGSPPSPKNSTPQPPECPSTVWGGGGSRVSPWFLGAVISKSAGHSASPFILHLPEASAVPAGAWRATLAQCRWALRAERDPTLGTPCEGGGRHGVPTRDPPSPPKPTHPPARILPGSAPRTLDAASAVRFGVGARIGDGGGGCRGAARCPHGWGGGEKWGGGVPEVGQGPTGIPKKA